MEQNTLAAETGREHGSGSSRRLRGQNLVPAVVYGAGVDPVTVTVDRIEFRRVLNAAGANAVITLDIDGKTQQLTFVRDLQIHPIKDRVQHIDFLRVDAKQRITTEVPILLVGEADELGREGGIVEQLMASIVLDCPVIAIPRAIEADISELSLSNPVRLSELTLGDDVTTDLDPETLVVTGALSRATLSDEEEGIVSEEGVEGEEGDGEEGGEGESDGADSSEG